MSYALRPTSPPELCPLGYAVFNDYFSREECGAVIALGVSFGPTIAQVGGGAAGVVDAKKRISDVRWINWHPTNEWLFAKLAVAIAESNRRFFGFHLSGMNEPLQLTHYKGSGRPDKGGHYGWHEDHGPSGDFQFRKLSVVMQLSDTHKGGRFRFLHHDVDEQKVGTLMVFPSFRTHCVEPVTKGERWSLVGWVTGPTFV